MKLIILFAFTVGIYNVWFVETPPQARKEHYQELKKAGHHTAKSMATSIKNEIELFKESK